MFLTYFDLISENNCIYYKGAKQHISKIGGLLTILVYLTVIFFACYFSIDAVFKQNPTSYFFKKFIPEVDILYLNSTMFHYLELLDPDDNVIMDEESWMIFGTSIYIDDFLLDFNISKISHWNYGLCNNIDDKQFKEINDDKQYLKAWCSRGYWNATNNIYYTSDDKEYIPPFIGYGTSSKTFKNIGYGIYVAKCQNTPFRKNCKPIEEINEEFKKLLRIKVSVIDNNFDVTLYKNPIVPYFLDIKNHLTGETITINNLNFNPVIIQTNDGLVFNTNNSIKSYILDFNEKLTYERGNTTLLSAWYFVISNLCETYTRTYPKVQEALANVGGALKAILMLAEIINYLFNQWRIILDIQFECEKLGLEYSSFDLFGKNNINLQKQKFEFSISKQNNNKNTKTNADKSSSKIPLGPNNISSKNLMENKFRKINYYVNFVNKNDKNSKINSKINNNINSIINSNSNCNSFSSSTNKESNNVNNLCRKINNNNNLDNSIEQTNIKQETKRDYNLKKSKRKKSIYFSLYLKSLFKGKIKNSHSNIRLMKKFWINKISEENIVHMDLKLYKLINNYEKGEFTHINHLIDDFKDKKLYKNINNNELKKNNNII